MSAALGSMPTSLPRPAGSSKVQAKHGGIGYDDETRGVAAIR